MACNEYSGSTKLFDDIIFIKINHILANRVTLTVAIFNNEPCNNNTRNGKIIESEKVQLTLYLMAG